MPASLNLDDLIRRVLGVAVEGGDRDHLKECVPGSEFVNLCHAVKKVLLQQPAMIEVEPPITVVGDIHGQFRDLVRIFNRCGYPPHTNYLFLGDYVDRGKQSLETACLLFAYKLKYPENFFLLRGNHECASVNKVYGFYEECARRYSVRLWQTMQEVFNCLPFTGLISGRIICMHGGLSPHLRNWQQLRNIRRPLDPVEPLHTDLLWSDPDNFISGWGKSPRGISGVFGADVVQDFCARMEVDLIVRAHQVVQDGYELFANRRLVTVFSAPRYCGTFDNAGGMMTVSEDLTCSFHILKPALKPLRIVSS